ncbi:type III secretion system (T3SS) inner membrane Yop/YscD-like protein [Salana multivorans]|uniref:Type III secretion system (T3SS) inner membrane Yop/YscD-like protein n=1 Tax=Salana multivorans TaxID=120377 RepID=A0A3N2D182_9MICO|nr:FHA domain-containing protein [Salana multivorans]MBN8881065.1 FHA domain-containing protein [Salana multivorans]ROR93532.1 type III secretion system (T3SS) inner membrane Yop/YscD-like protein [Salana multivorans]
MAVDDRGGIDDGGDAVTGVPIPDSATTAYLPAYVDPAEAIEPAQGQLDVTPDAAIEALPPSSALLVVQHGPNSGARFLLDAPTTSVGRDTSAEIFLDDVTVSRRHAEFRRVEDGFEVRDVGSLNGTYVNRERIEVALLHAGDEVQIGKYRLTFHPSPQRPSSS